MNGPLADTWTSRDLPVLREIARQLDAGAWRPSADNVANALEIDRGEVCRAFRNLHRGGLVEYPPPGSRLAGFEDDEVQDITGMALREIGAWPTPDMAASRLIEALEAIVENSPDEPTRTRAQTVLDGVKGFGRDTLVGIATAVITGQIPGAGS